MNCEKVIKRNIPPFPHRIPLLEMHDQLLQHLTVKNKSKYKLRKRIHKFLTCPLRFFFFSTFTYIMHIRYNSLVETSLCYTCKNTCKLAKYVSHDTAENSIVLPCFQRNRLVSVCPNELYTPYRPLRCFCFDHPIKESYMCFSIVTNNPKGKRI